MGLGVEPAPQQAGRDDPVRLLTDVELTVAVSGVAPAWFTLGPPPGGAPVLPATEQFSLRRRLVRP